MIKSSHSLWGRLFFNNYARIKLNKQFQNIHFVGSIEDNGLPTLIISNHFSWWDGFIQIMLNKKILQRQFHVMMLEEQLRKFMLLTKYGAFSVQKNSRSIIESLNYSIDLLNDSKNLLLLFPQGEIQSLYTDEFKFETGLQYILSNKKTDIQLIFNINLIDYFSDKRPSLTIYFKKYELTKSDKLQDIEADFNHFAQACKIQQKGA
jgi:1-acyl-sn-glycerol-3-phosphate acyltransferase